MLEDDQLTHETLAARPPNSSTQAAEMSRLLELANAIQAQVTEMQKHLTETGQPDPSFDGQTKATDYKGIDDTRSAVLENLTHLQELLMTPQELLFTPAPTALIARHVIDRFRIMHAIPVTGSRTYEELAWATMLPIKTLRRNLRHAMRQRIFHEPSPGHIAHTQASRLLAEDDKTRDYLGTVLQEVWPAATRACDAMVHWPGSRERCETGYQLAFGRTMEETLERNPVKRARYNNAMGALTDDWSFSLEHVVRGYDWAGLGRATVLDLGGGVGTASLGLAEAFPLLEFVVEDREGVIANAAVDDPEIQGRITFVEHDILQEQPVKDAEVYFIRRVLMQMTDSECIDIFNALKPAMKCGSKVIVQDPMIPDPGTCPVWQERRYRDSDMLAFVSSNSSPREWDDWERIFEQAGPGFKFQGVTMAPCSNTAFVEAIWQGGSAPVEEHEGVDGEQPDQHEGAVSTLEALITVVG
ncbi:hypothetical protein LTR37_020756 [Vermiconidia calcicola]|uniref:Uncharacterized protein n=1 Tax=Vermiconidia calcicola TaxID=1690605 RepID=A0ACC3MAI0_9PEZI|nr:hypothetical protein LTR37_020756 [Vermiconidia calcicola]